MTRVGVLTVAAVICVHTEERWNDILSAVESVRAQTRSADEIVLLVDHNPALFTRLNERFQSDVLLVENDDSPGISGARNAATRATSSDVIAFLDDDAVADPAWIESLLPWFADPTVAGVGGHAEPNWDTSAPSWFPAEFNWVVGCSYAGLPQTASAVRNMIGCNMSIRRSAWEAVGGFDERFGRVGGDGQGCDETEFCIRVTKSIGGRFINEPEARVRHRVPASRATLGYFVKRCRSEGRSKANLARIAGRTPALESERTYVLSVLPKAIARGFVDLSRADFAGPARAAAIVAGTAATGVGYLESRIRDGGTVR